MSIMRRDESVRSNVSITANVSSTAPSSISRRVVLGLPLLAAPLFLTACGAETLLSCGFNSDPTAQPPLTQQTVGTVTTFPGNGRVEVTVSPIGEANEHWVLVQHPNFNDVTSILCNFSSMGGEGQYTATARLFIPAGARGGVPSISFSAFQDPSSLDGFLHLDFLQDGTVRVNDDPALVFGSYQREQLISVLVTLNITATGATASISLLGAANGSLDVTIPSFFLEQARRFGAVRVWMGANFTGAFYVDDVSVIKSTP